MNGGAEESIADRLDRLESTIERQQEVIGALWARLPDDGDDSTNTGGVGPRISRRSALKAGGLAGLLALGTGVASADPQGQVGTADDPLTALHTAELNGGVTGGEAVTDLFGSALEIDGGALSIAVGGGLTVENGRLTTVADVPVLTVDTVAAPTVRDGETFVVDVTVAESAGIETANLSVALTVIRPDGTVAYEETIDANEVKGGEGTVTFGVDGSTPELGPFATTPEEYTATATAEATNATTATRSAPFVVTGFAGGDGSADAPYEIESWYHLDLVRRELTADYVLMTDLDESTAGYDEIASPSANGGAGFAPLGTGQERFAGSFDGAGHVVRGLTIDRDDVSKIGLFGETGSQSAIERVGLVDASITGGEHSRTGGLVGRCQGTVRSSYVTGSVTGHSSVGGLAGYNLGSISASYARCSVEGSEIVGGLVGENVESLEASYAAGQVQGNSQTGGLVGFNDGAATDGAVHDSYWDTGATGQTNPIGRNGLSVSVSNLTGLPTAQMQGPGAESSMSALDFATIWTTQTDDYPTLQVFHA